MAVIKDKAWLKSLCRAYTEANIKTLGGWAVGDGVDPDLKMRAIIALLDRGWDKPAQDNTHDVKGGMEIVIRDIAAEKAAKKT